jgi:cell division transport system ATP-binding protein
MVKVRLRTVWDDHMLRMQNVGLSYGGGTEILKDVSLHLAPQSFHFLTGPSGAGKSSLLRLVHLTLQPTRGLIHLFGENVTDIGRSEVLPIRRRIGVVFQDFRLLDHMSVFENVALPLRVRGLDTQSYAADVADLIDWVGLKHHLQSSPMVLSGGEQQRVAIARAVVTRPELLIADEPTGNVDPALAKRLLHLFLELNRQGTTVLIASHDEALVALASKPVLTLQDGRIV